MKEKLAKLIDVKSIVTLLLTVVFCVLCLIGTLPTAFLSIYTMVMGFYFGTQAQKQAEAKAALPTQAPVALMPTMGDTESTYEPVDAATSHEVHPLDVTAKVGFEY